MHAACIQNGLNKSLCRYIGKHLSHQKKVFLCCRLGKPANPGDRDNFPIFFRRGKMPMGAYKVEGPQAQARKKNELLSWRLRRCLFAFERVYSLQVSITEKERTWHSGTRHLSGYWDFGWFPFASTNLGAIWSQGLCTATTSKSIWLWLASMMSARAHEERHCISLLLSTGSALGKLFLLHLWCRWVRSSVNFCERINISIFLYINPRALFLFVFERISILTEISVHLCTTHPAYLWKGVEWFAKPWSQVHSKILHQRTWWRVGSSYWCTLAWASSAQARYIEHVIERGTYI